MNINDLWNGLYLKHDRYIWVIGEDPDAGKDWRQKEKGEAEDEMFR